MARGQYKPTPALEDLSAIVRHAESSRPSSWVVLLNVAGSGRVTDDVIELFQRQTPAEVEAVKLELRAFLRSLAGQANTLPAAFAPRLQLLRAGPDARVVVSGDKPRDVTLYLAAAIAQEAGVERLRCCPAPDCGRAFVKIGRREYCSAACQRRVFLSNYDPFAARPTLSRVRRRGARNARKTTRKR
jgi:hypothetical protein